MIESYLFISLWFTFPIFWFKILKFSEIPINMITPPSFLILIIFLQQYIGLPFIYYDFDSFRTILIGGINNVLPVFLFTSLVITQILIGFYIARKLFGSIQLKRFISFNDLKIKINEKEILWISFLIFLGVFVLFKYVNVVGLENIPLIILMNSSTESMDFGILRSNMTNNFSGSYHWYKIFMHEVLRMATYSSFAFFLLKRNLYAFFVFIFGIFSASFSSLIATEKGPFLWNIISLFLVYSLVKNKGVIKIKNSILLLLPLITIGSIMYIQFMGENSIILSVNSVLSRSIMGAITPLGAYLDIFPNKIDFLYGRSFPNPGGIFPFEHFELTKEVMKMTIPSLSEIGIVGSRPTFFWGELYANFGISGLFVIPIYVGIVVYYVTRLFLCLPSSPLSIGFFIWLTTYISDLAKTSISNYLIPLKPGIVFLLFILGLFLMGSGRVFIKKHPIEQF